MGTTRTLKDRVLLSVPPGVVERWDEAARKEGKNRSAWVVEQLDKVLSEEEEEPF